MSAVAAILTPLTRKFLMRMMLIICPDFLLLNLNGKMTKLAKSGMWNRRTQTQSSMRVISQWSRPSNTWITNKIIIGAQRHSPLQIGFQNSIKDKTMTSLSFQEIVLPQSQKKRSLKNMNKEKKNKMKANSMRRSKKKKSLKNLIISSWISLVSRYLNLFNRQTWKWLLN